MHEISLMASLLETAERSAREAGAERICSLRVRVGALSGVVAEAFEFAFQALRDRTMAREAVIEIEHVAARCRCGGCGGEFEPASPIYACPRCGQVAATILAGRELVLVSMEVE
ncbi:MAG: hydrogenase maturation nickel metallochaperone HypA [Chthonomonadales bacterium]|nr:hydrogenase maturation nickel metallochaperone HypA [Chthonomonadales bacterium]